MTRHLRLAIVLATATACPFDSAGLGGSAGLADATEAHSDERSEEADTVSSTSSNEASSDDDDGTGTSSSGAVGPICGNDIVKDGELCDDGDKEDADGCNVDCRPSGTLQWSVLDSGPDGARFDRAIDIEWDQNGHVLAVGVRDEATDERQMLFVARTAEAGDLRWAQSTGPLDRTATCLAFDAPGETFYVGGYSGADPNTNGKLFAYAYDAARPPASASWNVAFDDTPGVRDEVQDVAVMRDGTIVVAGVVFDNIDAYVMRVDFRDPDDGDVLPDSFSYAESPFHDSASALALTPNESICLGGTTDVGAFGAIHSWIGCMDGGPPPGPPPVWSHTGATLGSTLGIAAQDDVVVAVGANLIGTLSDDPALFVSTYERRSGAELWTRQLDGPGVESDVATDVVLDGVGDIVVVGYTTNAAGNEDGWLSKFSPDGSPRWTLVVDGDEHGPDRLWGLALDDTGRVYVAGEQSVPSGTRAWMAMVTP